MGSDLRRVDPGAAAAAGYRDAAGLVHELVAAAIANTESRAALARLAEEQAALRRVATLVARGESPEQVFAAVAGEVGGLLEVDYTVLIRSDPEDMITVVGAWTATGAPRRARSAAGSRSAAGT